MPQLAESIIRARFLVATLGEAASPPWWRSQATSPAGQRMLARLFPRTHLISRLETASHAARIVHDERIGRIGAYHLFRLPSAYEAAVRDFLYLPEANKILQELAAIDRMEDHLNALPRTTSDRKVAMAQGPVNCGVVQDLARASCLDTICAAYASGFIAGKPVYPYLEQRAL